MRRRIWWWGRLALACALGSAALVGLVANPSPAAGSKRNSGATSAAAAGTGSSTARIVARLTKPPYPPGPGALTQMVPDSPALVSEGRALFEQSCSSCHGMQLQGRKHVAPSLIGVGAGPPLFYLTTGRMPLAAPRYEPMRERPLFFRRQINALVDYISTFGGPPAPAANPNKGDLSQGFKLFTLNCAGCHQIVARGGITVGAVVPNLLHATANQIAEAVRMGPYLMPRFSPKQINQEQLNSLTRYILYTQHPDNAGGWGIYNIGPIPEGIIIWFVGLVALIIVARLIGERTA